MLDLICSRHGVVSAQFRDCVGGGEMWCWSARGDVAEDAAERLRLAKALVPI